MGAGLATGPYGEIAIRLAEEGIRNATSIVITRNLIMAERSVQEEPPNMIVPRVGRCNTKLNRTVAKLNPVQVSHYGNVPLTKYFRVVRIKIMIMFLCYYINRKLPMGLMA